MATAMATVGVLSQRQLRGLRCRTDRWGVVLFPATVIALLVLVPGLGVVGSALAIGLVAFLIGGAVRLAAVISNGVPAGTMGSDRTWYVATAMACAVTGTTRRSLTLLLVQDPQPNASAVWAVSGRAIVVTSGLVAMLGQEPDSETIAQFVAGHEVGHVLLHQPWLGIVQTLGILPGLLGVAGQFATLGWRRAAERSADRVGLICTGSVVAAVRGLLALSLGRVPTADEVLLLLRSLPERPGGVFGYAAESMSTHPFLRPRIEALFAFAASRQFAELARPEIVEGVRWELAGLGLRPDQAGGPRWPR